MKRIAIIVMLLTMVSKLLGFGKELVLSYFYGASEISDAYIISLTIPTVIFSFIGIAITTTFIPMFHKVKEEEGEYQALNFTNNLINVLMIVLTFFVVIVIMFATPIVKVFASGFEGDTLTLASKLTQISIISIYFSALVYIMQGYLHVNNEFKIPALVGLPLNIVLIVSIILSYYTFTLTLGLGKVIAAICQVLFLLPFLIKKDYKYEFTVDFKDKRIAMSLLLAIPVMLGTSVNQINQIVDRTIASNIVIGGISALNYANRLNIFIQGVVVMSIATVFFAHISKKITQGDLSKIKGSIRTAIIGINLIVVPITIGTMTLSTEIIELLFGRGAFDREALNHTASALYYYSIGMFAIGLREILSRVFFALEDTKTPMVNAAIGMGLNIILNIILSKFLGVGGLALATSIAAMFTTILLFISLRKKIGSFYIQDIIVSFVKILLASSLMGVIVKFAFDNLHLYISQTISLILVIVLGGLSYFIIIYFMKIKDFDLIINSVKNKIRQKIKL